MSKVKSWKAAKEKLKEALDEVRETVKGAFGELSRNLFDANPLLESVTWKQYTPFFCDGEQCEFSANTDYPDIGYTDGEVDEDLSDYDIDRKRERGEKLTDKELTVVAVLEFLAAFDQEDFREAFGDHVEVTLERAEFGVNVVVEDYDSHD